MIFELEVPKHLDTAMIDVDIHPQYVRVVCKEKLTQLKLPEEVNASASKVQRSKTTGFLKVIMPTVAQASEGARGSRGGEQDGVGGRGSGRGGKDDELLRPLQPEDDGAGEGDHGGKTSAGVGGKTNAGVARSCELLEREVKGEMKEKPKINLFELHRDPIARDHKKAEQKKKDAAKPARTLIEEIRPVD